MPPHAADLSRRRDFFSTGPFVPAETLPFKMRFFAYVLGFLLLIGGLAWGAIELGAPQLWVIIGSMILLGVGIISGARRTGYNRTAGDVTVVRDNDEP